MRPADPTELLEHLDWMRGLARDLVRDPGDADDVVQEAWLAATRQPPSLAAVRPWLRSVMKNVVRQRVRRESGRWSALEPDLPDSADEPLETVARAEMGQLVTKVVLGLADPYRSSLLDRYFEGLTPLQMARRDGVSVATVKTRLQRGRARVREALDREHGERGSWVLLCMPLLRAPDTAPLPHFLAGRSLWALGLLTSVALVVALVLPWGGLRAQPTAPLDASASRNLAELETVAVAASDRVALPMPPEKLAPLGASDAAVTHSISGLVHGADGVPIVGANVVFRGQLPHHRLEGTTDTNGYYQLDLSTLLTTYPETDVRAELHFTWSDSWNDSSGIQGPSITVSGGEGHAESRVRLFDLPVGSYRSDFLLADSLPLRARVIDAETGAPLSGVELTARPRNGSGWSELTPTWHASAVSGQDGRAVLNVGRYELALLSAADSGRHVGGSICVVGTSSAEHVIEVSRAFTATRLEVVNQMTGKPIEGAIVRDLDHPSRVMTRGSACELTRAEGSPVLRVVVEAEGFAPGSLLLDGSSQEQTVKLYPTENVEIQFIGSGPAPVQGILRWRWLGTTNGMALVSLPAQSVRLDPHGRCTIPIARWRPPNHLSVGHDIELILETSDGSRWPNAPAFRSWTMPAHPTLTIDLREAWVPLEISMPRNAKAGTCPSRVDLTARLDVRNQASIYPDTRIECRLDSMGRGSVLVPKGPLTSGVLMAAWEGEFEMLDANNLRYRTGVDGSTTAVLELGGHSDDVRLSGTVIDALGAPAGSASTYIERLRFRPRSPTTGRTEVGGSLRPDGTFDAGIVAPGEYELRTPGLSIQTIRAGESTETLVAPEPYAWEIRLVGPKLQRRQGNLTGVCEVKTAAGTTSSFSFFEGSAIRLPALLEVPRSIVVRVEGAVAAQWTQEEGRHYPRPHCVTLVLQAE